MRQNSWVLCGALCALSMVGACGEDPAQPPVLTFRTPTCSISAPASSAQGDEVLIEGRAEDEDTPRGELRVELQSSLDDGLALPVLEETGAWSVRTDQLSAGEHELTLRVRDAQDNECLATTTLKVEAPLVPRVVFEPAQPTTIDDLRARLEPPGEAGAELRYTWFQDGRSVPQDADVVSSSLTTKGQTWRVEVTVGDLDPVSAEVTIANAAPSLDAATLGPAGANTLTVLTCAPGAADDPDGDAVTFAYAWRINQADVLGVTGDTLAMDQTKKGDEVACVVTPQDEDAGAPVSSNPLVIGNVAPGPPGEVRVAPEDADDMDTVSCDVSGAFDPDDAQGVDTLTYTYRWFKDGAELPGQTSGTLDAASLEVGDMISCEARATDGEATSDPVTSAAIEIQPSYLPPVVSNVLVAPNNPLPGKDDLTCTFDVEVYPDWQDASTIAWRVGGTVVPGETSATLSSLLYTFDDVVTCEVSAEDTSPMVGQGNVGMASVTAIPEIIPNLIKDIHTTPADAGIDEITELGNLGVFVADDGVHGRELWVTDGTPAGTQLLLDIRPGVVGSEPEH